MVKGTLHPKNQCCLNESSLSPYMRMGIGFLLIVLVLEKFSFVYCVFGKLKAAIFILIACAFALINF